MSITAKELSKILGLSEAAISLALNNKPGVSTSTRRRVLNAAREYGYDFTKKSGYFSSRKGTICFVIYKKSGAVVADTPFFSMLSESISNKCKKEHYDLDIKFFFESDNTLDQIYRFKSAQYAGVILLATEMTPTALAPFATLKTPLVILDAYFETLEYNYILINNIQGAYIATSYLIHKRKKQPGYLRSSYSIGNFDERADGFYKAIRANGMSTSKSIVHRLTPSEEGAYEDMKALIYAGEDLAQCYFADNDHIAIGAINALKEAGYCLPEDIAVVGFDDLPLCEYISPTLTTIHVPIQYMGETAVSRIIEIIEESNTLPIKIEVATTLKVRKSV